MRASMRVCVCVNGWVRPGVQWIECVPFQFVTCETAFILTVVSPYRYVL